MKLPWWSLLLAFALGWLVFRRSPAPAAPRIVTQYDTVRTIDTAWVTELKHDTVYRVNVVERVTHTPPETVYRVPPLTGLLALAVGHPGDSTLLLGFHVEPESTHYTIRRWQYQYWTPGPLKSVGFTATGTPAVDFYPPPATCAWRCKAQWSGAAVLAFELLRAVLGRP